MNQRPKSSLDGVLPRIGALLLIVLALVIVRYLMPDELLASSGRRYVLHVLPSGMRYVFLIVGIPLFLWLITTFNRK